ncbi:MAG: hypothetical protein Q9177_001076 [Variospora cf. flavescens]
MISPRPTTPHPIVAQTHTPSPSQVRLKHLTTPFHASLRLRNQFQVLHLPLPAKHPQGPFRRSNQTPRFINPRPASVYSSGSAERQSLQHRPGTPARYDRSRPLAFSRIRVVDEPTRGRPTRYFSWVTAVE